jgi:hypothetical protein
LGVRALLRHKLALLLLHLRLQLVLKLKRLLLLHFPLLLQLLLRKLLRDYRVDLGGVGSGRGGCRGRLVRSAVALLRC